MAKSISVIIPTYARPMKLARCLEALCMQSHQAFCVIVVDDGSPSSMEEVIRPFRERLDIRYIRQANAGPASARNNGAMAARTKFLAFTDDDCVPDKDWLLSFEAVLKISPHVLCGGHTVNLLADDPWAEVSQHIVDFLYEERLSRGTQAEFFTSNNLACSKELFARIGGFDHSFALAAAEDRDFGLRTADAGMRLVYVPSAIVGHEHDLSCAKFFRQHRNYGRGARHLRQRIKALARPKIPFAGVGFYARLLTYPLRNGTSWPLRMTAMIFLSQVALILGFLEEQLNERKARNPYRHGPDKSSVEMHG